MISMALEGGGHVRAPLLPPPMIRSYFHLSKFAKPFSHTMAQCLWASYAYNNYYVCLLSIHDYPYILICAVSAVCFCGIIILY